MSSANTTALRTTDPDPSAPNGIPFSAFRRRALLGIGAAILSLPYVLWHPVPPLPALQEPQGVPLRTRVQHHHPRLWGV
ncbi:uncharacterized protein LOC62_08G009829 [Vanrija pseudolonga]|uniref:Uncharacterized protein n=1 Tax=Vanrija pseudolonga TaxID=143232 RepID=A0AAF0YMP5_9TREE|nr:hypothetical protein LOC62_08G009829 [Vanrija pseudolonga]